MGSLANVLKKVFGSKEDRDMKAIKPVLAEVLKEYDRIDKFTDNQLRAESQRIKGVIRNRLAEDVEKRAQVKAQLEDVNIETREKERLASEDDRLKKKINEEVEVVLNEVLPTAFAIMKSTARRFKEHEVIKVDATDFDKDLSTRFDYVEIDGDTAVWHNNWVAGGNRMTWDMVHYDVQLNKLICLCNSDKSNFTLDIVFTKSSISSVLYDLLGLNLEYKLVVDTNNSLRASLTS